MSGHITAKEARALLSLSTPGPWKATYDRGTAEENEYVEIQHGRNVLASIDGEAGQPCNNRHIIEAAPDLAASVIALHERIAALEAERDDLYAIINGRTVPPTDEEIEWHRDDIGTWLCDCFPITDLPDVAKAYAKVSRDIIENRSGPPIRWWPLDSEGRPCPWPVVPPVNP